MGCKVTASRERWDMSDRACHGPAPSTVPERLSLLSFRTVAAFGVAVVGGEVTSLALGNPSRRV